MSIDTKTSRSLNQSAAPNTSGGPLRVQVPRTYEGSGIAKHGDWGPVNWPEAHELAQAHREPLFVPVTPFVDDRGWSLMNLLHGAMSQQGQVNFSMQYPGVVKAWHSHDKQTDFWVCPVGHIKAGVFRQADGAAWMLVMGQMRPGVLIIPPPLWHGATCVGPAPAGLLYYVTHAYDPAAPDEHRRPSDSVEGFPWAARNG